MVILTVYGINTNRALTSCIRLNYCFIEAMVRLRYRLWFTIVSVCITNYKAVYNSVCISPTIILERVYLTNSLIRGLSVN